MNLETKEIPIIRIDAKGKSPQNDVVARELPLTIILNDRTLATLLASPTDLGYLATGFTLARGLIKGKESIRRITIDVPRGAVWIDAEETKPPAQKRVESDIKISTAEVFALIDEFGQHSELFKETGGVHSAALCDREGLLAFADDISRHNAIDRVFGQCLLEGIDTAGRLLITSGRVSSGVLLKVAQRNIPMLVSKAAATDLGVKLAEDLGVTLIGFARDKRMNVYTHEERLKES
jgi:FdhD protein